MWRAGGAPPRCRCGLPRGGDPVDAKLARQRKSPGSRRGFSFAVRPYIRARTAMRRGWRLHGDAVLDLGRLAQHVAAAPDGLDVVLALARIGELLPQLADEDVDDLELGLVHAAVEVVEEHLLRQRRALAQ